MTSFLFDLIYLCLLVAASPWLGWKMLRRGKYRQGLRQKVLGQVPRREGDGYCVWLHAVSVGEVNLLRPVVAELARRRPDWQCVISTTTPTGLELAKSRFRGHLVFYCPLDFSWAVKAALWRIRPNLLVLAELEVWPNLLRLARRRGVATAIINGRLGEKSFGRYRKARWLLKPVFGSLNLVVAQDARCGQRFTALGAPRVVVAGSVKFDGAQTDRHNPATRTLSELAGIGAEEVVFLAGSTQSPEEAIVLESYRALVADYPRLRLIIVPRHAERFDEVAGLLEASGLRWQRRSTLLAESSGTGKPAKEPPPILLVDTIGELGAWWGAAHIAFVGGSLGSRGGQNMIEPAAYGAAVCFGPNTRNFRDIVWAMLEAEAAVVVHNGDELTAFVRRCLAEPRFAEQLGCRARRLVLGQQGASKKTAELLCELGADAEGSASSRDAAFRMRRGTIRA